MIYYPEAEECAARGLTYNEENRYFASEHGLIEVSFPTLYFHDLPIKAALLKVHEADEELFEFTVNELSYMVLFLLIGDDPHYADYGFETIYKDKIYTLPQKVAELVSEYDIHPGSQRDLEICDRQFHRSFDGYFMRETGENLVFYQNDYPFGYLLYQGNKVKKLVYPDTRTAVSLLACLAKKYGELEVCLSAAENFDYLPYSCPVEEVPRFMVRISDYPIFNQLFHSSIRNVEEAFRLFHKPIRRN